MIRLSFFMPRSLKCAIARAYSYLYRRYYNVWRYCRITNETGVTKDKRVTEVIVSLTSYPARINAIRWTILSLLNQSYKPNRIVLWLASSQFPRQESDLPLQLIALKKYGLEICWTEDFRSYKKLVPALRMFPCAIIVTADDDVIYPTFWLELLINSYREFPTCVHCHRAHKIQLSSNGTPMPFLKWRYESNGDIPSFLNFLTGVGGVLYPPGSLDPQVLDVECFKKIAPTCDDHWFWAMAVKNGTRIRIVPNGFHSFMKYVNPLASTEFSLCKVNTGEDMKSNDDVVFASILKTFNLKEILRREFKRQI